MIQPSADIGRPWERELDLQAWRFSWWCSSSEWTNILDITNEGRWLIADSRMYTLDRVMMTLERFPNFASQPDETRGKFNDHHLGFYHEFRLSSMRLNTHTFAMVTVTRFLSFSHHHTQLSSFARIQSQNTKHVSHSLCVVTTAMGQWLDMECSHRWSPDLSPSSLSTTRR